MAEVTTGTCNIRWTYTCQMSGFRCQGSYWRPLVVWLEALELLSPVKGHH